MTEPHKKGFWGGFARVVTKLRWVIVPGWILGAIAATAFLPSFSSATGSSFSGILPKTSPAIQTEITALKKFGYPLLSRTVVVQYQPHGLSALAQARVVTRAARLDAHQLPGLGKIAGAIPVLNTAEAFPTSNGDGTTALTYLFFRPSVSSSQRKGAINTLAKEYISSPGDGYVGVTGAIPARSAEGSRISSALKIIELGAILVVFFVVAIAFRSIGAPIVTLLAVGVAYFTAVRVLAVAAKELHFALPGELEPLIVVLLVGIVTDYAIFFLSTHRTEYGGGRGTIDAARESGVEIAPIVLVAGSTVALGTATLLVAQLSLYHQLGPGMAISALVAFVVAITFVPAALALFGRFVFWPLGHPRERHEAEEAKHESGLRTRLVRLTVRRPVAACVLVGGVIVLLAALSPLAYLGLGLNIVSDLPAGAGPAQASAALAKGFAPGMGGLTEIVVQGRGVTARRGDLVQLQSLLSHQPGVAGVLGPADQPTKFHFGLFLASNGNAARYLVILANSPLGSQAITTIEHLESGAPALLGQARLTHAHAGFAGDTALAAVLTAQTRSAFLVVGGAILGVDLLMLVIFLRSLVVPVCLLAASLLSVLAAVGITTWVFQGLTGDNSLTFYVPIAVGVLLISFGSDYNIFVVGRIWEAAATRSLRDAIVSAVPRASSTVTRAGIALTLTFALLAIIPLKSFRAFAFGMAVGILLDTFLVRSVLIPAILTVLGRWSAWPNRRLMGDLAQPGEEAGHDPGVAAGQLQPAPSARPG